MEVERDPRSRFDGTPRSSGFTRSLSRSPSEVFRASVPQSGRMDEATSRALPPTRRMASARTVSTVRGRSAGGAGPGGGKDPGEGLSRARWAGVGLVFAALLGAIGLAMLSPGEGAGPGPAPTTGAPASPVPGPSVLDTRIPTAQPEITQPLDGAIVAERRIDVEVFVPKESLPRKLLALVILSGEEEVGRLERPQTDRKQVVTDVILGPGETSLTAALYGPGGPGPRSAPVRVIQDLDAPTLRITAPETGARTVDDSVIVSGTSEPGASVTISNEANGSRREGAVSPAGTFEERVPLEMGRNRITVTSVKAAGTKREAVVVVIMEDGRPTIKLSITPRSVARSQLPRQVKVGVEVLDPAGEPLQDAAVSFYLAGPGWVPEDLEAQTDADGRATWQVDVVAAGPGSGESEPIVTVEVVAPDGQRNEERRTISIE